MEMLFSLLLILGMLCLGMITPGPSFVLVAKVAVSQSRKEGIAAAIGMGLGGCVFALVSLMGLHAVLNSVPALYLALKILGGCYLVFLAAKIFLSASKPLAISENSIQGNGSRAIGSFRKSCLLGFVTQVSNPKTAIVYGSIFAALLPAEFPVYVYLILPPAVFFLEACWYAIVAVLLSATRPRLVYAKFKTVFDRVTAAALSGLGGKLIYDAGTS